MWRRLLDALPRGYTLDEHEWQRRHRLLLWVLGIHVPGLAVLGLLLGKPTVTVATVLAVPTVAVGLGYLLRAYRRTASIIVTFGLVYCSAALVAFTDGRIEAHFHFFIIIGFIALYQDWAPFLLNIVFTVISHGIGSAWQRDLIFNHTDAQANPWVWSLIHGIAVLFACMGMMLFWRVTEESQEEKDRLSRQLSDIEIGRRQFTSDLLTNLARRNQSLLYRQLDIINQLEESEQDPDALAELFRLDHIATRVRRNAENLLVLSGEQPPRTWSEPVPLRDVLRAAIAETEDLSRVVIVVDEQTAIIGHAVTDLTHLLAELTENAVRFSPPDTSVTVRIAPRPPRRRRLAAHRGGLGHRHGPRGVRRHQRPARRPARAGLLGLAAVGLPRRRAARGPARDQRGAVGHPGLGRDGARPHPRHADHGAERPAVEPDHAVRCPSRRGPDGRGVGAKPAAQPVPHPRPQPVAQAVPQPRPQPAPRALLYLAARHEGRARACAAQARTAGPARRRSRREGARGLPVGTSAPGTAGGRRRRPTEDGPRPPAHAAARAARRTPLLPRTAPPRAADAPGRAAAGARSPTTARTAPTAAAQRRAGRRERADPLPGRARLREQRRSAMTRTTGRLDWMLADFTRDIPGVDLAVVLSADGLRLATSPGVTRGPRRPDRGGRGRARQPGPRHGAAPRRRQAHPDASSRWKAGTCSSRRSPRAPRWWCTPPAGATWAWSATR